MIYDKKVYVIQNILYGLAFFIYLAATIVMAQVLFKQLAMVKGVDGADFIMNYLKLFGFLSIAVYGASALVLGIGFLLSICHKLSLKKNAVILNVFFVIGIVICAAQVILGGSLSSFLIEVALPVAMIISIAMNFGSGEMKHVHTMYFICGIYSVYTVVQLVLGIGNYGSNIFSLAHIIALLSKVFLCALILFQVYCAEKNNKKISE